MKNDESFKDFELVDHGCPSNERVDYPNFAKSVAEAVAKDADSLGILVCGTGIGIGIAANKIQGIRASVCHDYYSALISRKNFNCNIVSVGGRVTGVEVAK